MSLGWKALQIKRCVGKEMEKGTEVGVRWTKAHKCPSGFGGDSQDHSKVPLNPDAPTTEEGKYRPRMFCNKQLPVEELQKLLENYDNEKITAFFGEPID